MADEHDGDRLARLMGRAKVTMAELSRLTGASKTGVKKWVTDGHFARESIASICVAVRCSADELLGLAPIGDEPSRLLRPDEEILGSALQTVDEVLRELGFDYPAASRAKLVIGCYNGLRDRSVAETAKNLVVQLMESLKKPDD